MSADPRPSRLEKKRLARRRRATRRDLVHAAGCTYRGDKRWAPCMDRQFVEETIGEAIAFGVSIPRSLRHLIPETPVFVCPGCQAIAAEPHAPWCPDESMRRTWRDEQWRDEFYDEAPLEEVEP